MPIVHATIFTPECTVLIITMSEIFQRFYIEGIIRHGQRPLYSWLYLRCHTISYYANLYIHSYILSICIWLL